MMKEEQIPTARQPGAVNAHTHLYSALAPLGMPVPAEQPRSFIEILEQIWWRLDRALDEASLRASARLGLAEALLRGTTALIDHHESPCLIEGSLDILSDAAEELGARLLVCYGATERNHGRDEARRGLAACRRFVRENRRAGVRGLVGLHASFTVSDETIREAGALAQELGVPVHVHVAEDAADVADARRRGYAGPLERLLALGALPPGSILAHGVHLDEGQVRAAERAGLWLVQNPRSNEGNRVGYPGALRQSSRVALGTDGYVADMDEEARALRRLGAMHGDAEDAALSARVAGGARLCAEHFGALDGDWVVRDEAGAVREVAVGGQLVVADGALVRADMDAIRAEAAAQAEGLWGRMRAVR